MTTTSEPARLIRGYGWWTLLLITLLAAGAWGLALLEPARYRAEATLVAEPRVRAAITPVPADPATESEIARSAAVLRPAATSLGISQQMLADGLHVTPASAGTTFTIAYEASTAPTARTRAQAVATQYAAYRNASTAQTGISASLITPAASATRVTWLPRWLYPAIGAAAGLLLGALVAWLRSRDRVRGRVHFEHLTGLPVLATIPRARRSRGPGAPLPVLLRSPASADAEAYRYLRARLEACLEGPATVLITSAHEGEGRSTTAANLAIALAQSGRRVVLIDTDVRGPVLHQMFALSRDRGLTGILTGDISGASALRDGPVPNLRLMAAGPDQPDAPDLLAASFGEMLRELKSNCDVIVLDSAPTLHVADAVALAAVSDLVLLVADFTRLTRSTAHRAAAELTPATAAPVAAVLIALPENQGGLIPHTRAGRAPAPPRETPAAPTPPEGPLTRPDPATAPTARIGGSPASPARPTATRPTASIGHESISAGRPTATKPTARIGDESIPTRPTAPVGSDTVSAGRPAAAGPPAPISARRPTAAGPPAPISARRPTAAGPPAPISAGRTTAAGPPAPISAGRTTAAGPPAPISAGRTTAGGPTAPIGGGSVSDGRPTGVDAAGGAGADDRAEPSRTGGSAILPPALGLAARARPSGEAAPAPNAGGSPASRPATATGAAFKRHAPHHEPGSGPTVPNVSAGGPRRSATSEAAPNPPSSPTPTRPTSAPPVVHGPPAATAKTAIPQSRVYTSAAASEGEPGPSPDQDQGETSGPHS
ncbi:polysaccharide biosynthesis tyrosine autokinase [Actinoplanes sp. NPDC048796]|uniref:polysaccharide biosynthesis tyrosine autokinase n=1 Tax=Actinoplanes sp. NPDC048796 TaxID=3155640 RepID=UPI0033EF483B